MCIHRKKMIPAHIQYAHDQKYQDAEYGQSRMEEFFFRKIPLNIMITPKIADVMIAFIAYWFFI